MRDARDEYADMINRDHHVSKKRPQMSRINRAAQFSPFAALTGYDDLVQEAARFTNQKQDLDAEEKDLLNQKIVFLLHQPNPVEATFTVFTPDSKKDGGEYAIVTGRIIRHDALSQSITLDNGTVLLVDDIREITCDAFDEQML